MRRVVLTRCTGSLFLRPRVLWNSACSLAPPRSRLLPVHPVHPVHPVLRAQARSPSRSQEVRLPPRFPLPPGFLERRMARPNSSTRRQRMRAPTRPGELAIAKLKRCYCKSSILYHLKPDRPRLLPVLHKSGTLLTMATKRQLLSQWHCLGGAAAQPFCEP
eukprot:1187075-Prorocentrum_minimum.AAC.1